MISIYNEIFTYDECNQLTEWYDNSSDLVVRNFDDNIYHFDGIDIIEKIEFFSITKKLLKKGEVDRLRIQRVGIDTPTVNTPHSHITPYSFIIFLNDDFEGGELVFNNITIKPKIGQVVYFTGNELHYVKKVHNKFRYTLVCFLKSHIDIPKSTTFI